jgi:hypothetical protein
MELKLSDVYQEILWHAMAYSPIPSEHELFEEIWGITHKAVSVLSSTYDNLVAGKSEAESAALLASPEKLREIGQPLGMEDEAVKLVRGVLNYGPAQLKYAHNFLALADTHNRRPTDEFFRRFVQYVFPVARGMVYRNLSAETWRDFDERCKAYSHMRMRDLGWLRS